MRKIRVMLVDDEKAIREILKIKISWEKYDMVIAGEADSGSQAISIIDTVVPDILIVDIKMPFMNGIEFSRIISERYPNIKIIILSAYADFEYAKECIEIRNVLGYLLKPVDAQEMEKTLKQFRESVDEKFMADAEESSSEKSADNGEGLIIQIENYIMENYANEYMNIGAIAESLGYSPGYLGMTYKKRTGMLLSDKIFSVRMEHAIQYKRSGEKMYLVAKKVGIADPFYFLKCFRKYTGKSYSEFNEQGEKA